MRLLAVRWGKVAFHSIFAVSQLPAAAIATWSTSAGYRKPAFPISLADRNGLKNLPRQIFSACVKFGGNRCRDVDTLSFYTNTQTDTHTHRHTHTHTHTGMKLYIRLAVIPVLCTGRQYFLFTINRPFQSLCLALLSHATAVPVCMCVTHHLPFIGSLIYLYFGPSCWNCIFKLPRLRAF